MTEIRPAGASAALPPRILWIDDEDDLRDAVKPLLEALPARVVTADCGDAAIEHLIADETRADPFKLVIVDMWVPRERNGDLDRGFGLRMVFGMNRSHRLLPPETPIIVFTSHQSYDDCVACMKAWATDYLPKADEQRSNVDLLVDRCHALLFPRAGGDPASRWLERELEGLIPRYGGKCIGLIDQAKAVQAGWQYECRGDYMIVPGDSASDIRMRVVRDKRLRWEEVRILQVPMTLRGVGNV